MVADPFAWYELMTPDPAASGEFYRRVVGWTTQAMGEAGSETSYTTFLPRAGLQGVAGMLETPPGGKPGWIGYIHVGDVDDHVARIVAAGGTLHREPSDVPGMLRFAVVADPQGTPFAMFTPLPPMDASAPATSPAPDTPGYIGWRELVSTDWEAAWDFYSGLFGWTKDQAMDMGPMGTYQIFKTGGDLQAAGMMTGPAGSPAPFWLYYFNVDNLGGAIARVTEAGGRVMREPTEVPGRMWVVQAVDPQGIMFALVSSSK